MKTSLKSAPSQIKKSIDIIIFDETNSQLIMNIIPDTYSYSIYKTRPVEFTITLPIILRLIFNLKDIKIFEQFTTNKGFFKNILWQFLCIYIKSYIQIVKPKAVITSIDNCTKFAWLSKHIQNIPFIAIQNGFRLSFDQDNNLYHCQHLFCFGDFEVENFPKREWTVNNYYPVGSLNASMYFKDKYHDMFDKNEFDILVVSSWRGNIGFGQDVQDSMEAMRLFDLEFAAYLKNRALKAAVILRSERNSDQWVMPEIGMSEEDYYKSIYEDTIEIIDTNFSVRNIYPLMQRSKIVITGFCSTSLLEAFGIGKKILYCDYTNQRKYFCDFNPAITFTKKADNLIDTLDKRIDDLLEIPISEYEKCHNELIKYYQSVDKNNPAHEIIKTTIDNIIKATENIKV